MSALTRGSNQEVELEYGEGRNCTLFNDLRQLCYREASHYFGNEHALSSRVLTLALAMNQQFAVPLSPREIRAIAKSVTKWISKRFSAEAFSEIQRCRANRRWVGHASAEISKPWDTAGMSRATWYRQKKGVAR